MSMDPVKAEFWRLARAYLISHHVIDGENLRIFLRYHTGIDNEEYLKARTRGVLYRITAREDNHAHTPQT